ncbi:MAG: type I restriction endonuclease [Bacteroidetes bacterium]|nr:MAG: type I restriction endonuclease [Bacteroidota bacterium]
MNKFEYIMNRIAHRHGVYSVFSDFLDLLIYAFSHGNKEKEYLGIITKYEKPDAYSLSEALAALVIEMTGDDGNGMIDVLGEYFQSHLSHGANGQFFTPVHVCDLMAQMTNPNGISERIFDPACGSGRMLMSAAKVNRFAKFYGADIDTNCAKMTTINLFLNNLTGEVACMNTLSNEFFQAWTIEPTINGVPRIREITKHESYIYANSKLKIKNSAPVIPQIEMPVQNFKTEPTQQLLFTF